MGTHGAFGFYINGKEKVTYNHFDSYPEGLGYDVVNAIRKSSLEELRQAAERIEFIKKGIKPTVEQIKHCEPFTNLNVSEGSVNDWYCLLREAQGNLSAYTKQGLKYMSDGAAFLLDSLFCEWAYIINLDNNTLEIYKGFNRNPNAEGRYASQRETEDDEYYGVVLKKAVPLETIFELSEENKYDIFKNLCGEDDD